MFSVVKTGNPLESASRITMPKFSLNDGKINKSFSIDPKLGDLSKEGQKDLEFMFSLFHDTNTASMKLLLFINMINSIFNKYYNFINNQRFRNMLYSKITEFKEFNSYANDWSDKLNLALNLLDIFINNLHEHFPMDVIP